MVRILGAHGIDVVDAVASGPLLADALTRHRPDVAIVDVRLPPSFTDEGLRVAIETRRAQPGLPVLILSQHVEQLYARELLADGSGAIGYLLKDRVMQVGQFLDAVRRVAEGGTVMDPEVIAQLLTSRRRDDPIDRLTEREREVLALMAEGRTNAGIAARLSVTVKAVNKNINSIFDKLELAANTDDNRRVLAVLRHLDQRDARTA
ncbi:response regulator transcription factor [Pseudonocardia acaciae]|uniref:response regulator transcription factor n=1 Tax=Pseudonocardia acaciae TaxID=551276 RepID=UPI001FDF4360|nr:response regulator transcription factor [Pseudonocardia acaciae]